MIRGEIRADLMGERADGVVDFTLEGNESIAQPLLSYNGDMENAVADQEEEEPKQTAHLQDELIVLVRKVAGETLASFMVVFTLLAVRVNTYGNGVLTTLATSLTGGLVVMVAIFTLGHVSGSHINPAVTVAYTVIRHFPLQLAPLYVCAQLLGGILASLVLEVVFKPTWSIVVVTPVTTILQAVLAETLAGFLLLFVASSVSTDTRAIGEFAGLSVGAIIAIDIMIVGPISGGGINPARVLGPALLGRDLEHVWIYVVGPIVGGLLGAFAYRLLRPEEVRKKGVHQKINIRDAAKRLTFRRS